MTADERADLAMRLISMQGLLKDLAESAAAQATLCREVQASGLAMSAWMLEEAIRAYSKELTKWVAEYLAENPLDKK
jgi:hypothetical protein